MVKKSGYMLVSFQTMVKWVGGFFVRIRALFAVALLGVAWCADAEMAFEKGDTMVLHGNSMVERLLEHGELEAMLQLAYPNARLRVRSFAWTGDEVGHRLRAEGYAAHLKELIAAWPARVVVAGYGMNESFAGQAGLDSFRQAAGAHLDLLSRLHPGSMIIVLSPSPVEANGREGALDPVARNADITAYAKVLREVSLERKAMYVDLIEPFTGQRALTSNGMHLNDRGNRIAARTIATALMGDARVAALDAGRIAEVARAASQNAYYIAEVVRPKNGILYYGQRKRPHERAAEIPLYLERISKGDEVIHALVDNPAKRFEDIPPVALPKPTHLGSIGIKGGVGEVKPAAEAMAEFNIAEGYAVNLFASDEQFPELRAPVQIAFDAQGRLWVVTMPSFPHTIPGQPQEDKLLVLEDLDRDGRADKATVFAEGFDALDGVAFHDRGVIVSEQSRHWLLIDTDGDGRADLREELMRGLDVTDSHHGGMIATDPTGDVWFCDGVFHRSQLETPHGVHRAFDATTMRHNLRTGRITTEWQSDTPNPWKITFDRNGSPFQMYGGGHLLDGLGLTWTPLGAYHTYGLGMVLNYGKGSGATIISSPNFPAAYHQGSASASLLGKYVVSLTQHSISEGPVKGSGRLDVLASPNPAFRPVDLAFGFDGALYVSDFSSAIIGHAQNPMRDPRWNHSRGRVWRVIHEAGPVIRDWPKIEGASEKDLFALLSHPQDIVRHHARMEFRRLGAKQLDALLASQSELTDSLRLEALWIHEGLGHIRPALLDAVLNSPDEQVRAAGVRLVRLQADRLDDEHNRLARAAADPSPRVRMAVVNAVAQLRPDAPSIEATLAGLQPKHPAVDRMVNDLTIGITPLLRPSIPVLEISRTARVQHWQMVKPGVFRTLARAARPVPAQLGVRHGYLDVVHNGMQRLSSDNRWSPEQQASLELEPGLNVIEITFRKLKKDASMPVVSVFDFGGREPDGVKFPASAAELEAWASEYDQAAAAAGRVVRIQAVAGLQFSPREVRVMAGEQVRLVFDNPDDMEHNMLILAPGSLEEVCTLAEALAATPDGRDKHYIPSSPHVLHHTALVPPRGRETLEFTAPSTPGAYPILCTFPGHWLIMRATLNVAPTEPTP